MIIDFDLTQRKATPAWLKRFSLITSSSQSKSGTELNAWKSSLPIKLEATSLIEHETIIRQARDKAECWYKQTLFKELITYIKKTTTTSQDQQGLTMIYGQSWTDMLKLDDGVADICWEITSLIKELSKKYQIDVIADLAERNLIKDADQKKLVKKLERGMLLTEADLRSINLDETESKLFKDMSRRNMSLLVPGCYSQRTLTPPGTEDQLQQQLEQKFPNLKLVYIDDMSQAKANFALLIFDEWVQGKNEIGRFKLQGSFTLTPNPDEVELDKLDELDEHNKLCYELNFPAYQLSLLDPKQIAVLTGI